MHFIVCPLRPEAVPQMGLTGQLIQDREAKVCLKTFEIDKDAAITRAEQLAREHPGTAFAVFAPIQVLETQPNPPILRKKINENGELVMDKEPQA